MANQPYIAPGGQTAYRKSDGTGTDADPFLAWFREDGIRTNLGLAADTASSVGTINAKLRAIADNTAAFSGVTFSRTAAQYYASKAGGNVSFNATAGVISIGSTGGTALIISNPTGSGKDVYIQKVVLASSLAGTFQRFRQGTLNVTGTAITPNNRGGGTTMALAKVYAPSAATVTGGSLGKVSFVAANADNADDINGTLILPPGHFIYWTYQSATNATSSVAVEVVWWEIPAA